MSGSFDASIPINALVEQGMRRGPCRSMPRKSDTLTTLDYRLLAEFRHQLRQFLLFSEDAARAAGLQPRHHQALLAIKGFPGATIGDLAHRLGIKHHSTVELVDRLVRAHLVHRMSDAADRRCVHLRLTPKAERRLAELTLAHRGELKRLASLWSHLLDALVMGGPASAIGPAIPEMSCRHTSKRR